MKKAILIVFAGLLLAVSCSKKGTGADEPTPTPTPTPEKKACVTGEYSNLGAKSVTLFGWSNEKEEEGLYAVYGFEYSDSDLTTAASTVTAKSRSKDSSNKYSCDLTGLTAGTKYYYRAYSRFNGITSYGDVKTFTTTTIEASVTAEASDVKCNAATISGKLTVNSKGDFTKSAVLYYSSTESTLEALKSSGTKITLTLASDDSYSIDLTSLTRETQYYYIVVAKVDETEFDSGVKSFKTLEIEASVTAESSNVKCITATISGKLSVENEGTFTKSAVLYYSSTASTLEALKSSGLEKTLNLASDGSYSAVAKCPNDKTKYYYVVVAMVDYSEFASDVKSFTTVSYPVPELVDLGLSVKWATCNLGASKPEEYGGYYQWAGTQDVASTSIYLDRYYCPYHTGPDDETGWTKYVPSDKESYWSGPGSPDNKKVLDPQDDVAHLKLGGKWRMPTNDEWGELINNCTSEWRTLNGVSGRRFTSKKNGSSIFLPAAGSRYYDRLFDAGYSGIYGSSSLYTGNPYCAFYVCFYSGDVLRGDNSGRYNGLSVRPVAE